MDDYQAIFEATGELSKLLLEETKLETTLLGIGNLATSVIPACEEAGVTLESNGNVTARITTGETAKRVDAYQYEIDDGPCVAAADSLRPVLIEDMATEKRWPRFASFAAEQGVKSSYAIPMALNGEVIGVLNLYSTDDAFGPPDEEIGVRFAEQAAMAVRHAATSNKTKEMIDHLHRALETRDVIGAAVGIMMHRDRSTMEAAFARLKEMSQHENLKLYEVAERIITQFDR
ncbi:MAG: GAF and ANTAR domain-containing protein [Acidimicrobiia bacterium]